MFMYGRAQEALRTIAELNSGYRTPDEVRTLLSRLTGTTVEESVTVFPPFYCEFGQNLVLGKGVFINMGCRFQDTGGIIIGDETLIGHGSTLTTLNHAVDPDRRADMFPAPVVLGRKVWLGAAVTVVPGVTIGDGAICWRWCGGDQGRTGQHDRGWRPGQGHPYDRIRRRTQLIRDPTAR